MGFFDWFTKKKKTPKDDEFSSINQTEKDKVEEKEVEEETKDEYNEPEPNVPGICAEKV